MSTRYKGVELLTIRPDFKNISVGLLDDFTYEAEGAGLSTPWKPTTKIVRKFTLPFLFTTKAEIQAMRKFISRRIGTLRGFWCPTYTSDFDLGSGTNARTFSAGATVITTALAGFPTKWAIGNQFRHLAMISHDYLDCYGIDAAAVSGGYDQLTLDAVLSHDVTVNTAACPLLFVRLADAEVAYDYECETVARAVLTFIELPQETASNGASYTAHASDQTRIIRLFRFTQGATVSYYADYGVDVTAASLTWTATNIAAGEVEASTDALSEDFTITVRTDSASHPFVQFLQRLTMVLMTVDVFEYDIDEDDVDLTAPIYSGRVEDVDFQGDGLIEVTLSSILRVSEKRTPNVGVQRICAHSTYDAGCGLNVATYTTTGTVSAISATDPPYVEAVAFASKVSATGDANWFALGKVTIGTEVRMCVGTNGTNRLYLNAPFQGSGAIVGATVAATAGDNKRIGTCQTKFSNNANFLGFPYLPNKNPQFKALETPKPGGGKKA